MNERILELAKQAGLKFPSETAMSPVELKFAELIVRECISELRDAFDMTIEEGNHLKEHFGIEE